MKKIILTLFLFFYTLLTTFSVHADVLTGSVTYQGRKLEYAYHIPEETPENTDVSAIILVPGLNGKGEHLLSQVWIQFADKRRQIIIAPSFVFEGDKAFQQQKSYQYPKAWSGGALKAILKQFAKAGYNVTSLYMMGFSAGAQFVGRYALLNPNQVKKCAIIASGGNDTIQKSIPVQFFYGIGTNDAQNRREFADTFEKQAKAKHIPIIKKKYQGVGHELTEEMQNDVRHFFSAKKK